MKTNRGQLFIGGVLVALGLVLLLGKALHINLWGILWPLALIALGVWLVMRPQLAPEGTVVHQKLFGDIERKGIWDVTDEEIWMFAGDVDLDMSQADLPLGETTIHFSGFAGDITLKVPPELGVKVSANMFAGDCKFMGDKQSTFLSPMRLVSDNYETAESKLHLECNAFASDIKVERVAF